MKNIAMYIFIILQVLLCTECFKWIVEHPFETQRLHYYITFIIFISIAYSITDITKEG
jgi:hypothetical protein